MSRSGYVDDWDDKLWLYRRAVENAMNGKRGQAFLREMVAALDALPVKELEEGVLVCQDGGCCAMGAVVQARGLDANQVDDSEPEEVAAFLGIAPAMAKEIAFENDNEYGYARDASPADRWQRMRDWCVANLKEHA